MMRIGILGINDLTETFLADVFRLDPCAHVFLSAEDSERANILARKFPCWIQDNEQAVVNEADIVLITRDTTRSGKFEYRQTQLVLCLDVRLSSIHQTERIDDYLSVLRALLISTTSIHSLEVNVHSSSRSATLQDPE
jgi:hypothetical protein